MNEKNLSKRLFQVAQYVPEGARLADIGSDHAYLPTALVLANRIPFAIAGEVVEGPFLSAKKQVERLGLSEQVEVRLADGLEAVTLTDEIDAITIAGMGGSLIASILEAGKTHHRLSGKERLVLQPNVGEVTLRKWLMANQYQIINEEVLKEEVKIYEIIVAEKSSDSVSYTEEQLTFGVFLPIEKSTVFVEKWQSELEKLAYIMASLKKANKDTTLKQSEIEASMKQIKEML